jgi:nitrite reductase/ring-hydroxylating ferredoxin subunit
MAAAPATRPICQSSALVDGGAGVRFQVRLDGRSADAFVVRHQGVARAYLNVCAHRGVELDWEQGQFFDVQHRWLICSTHGALYEPATGHCVSGPCQGASLTSLPVDEQNGKVSLVIGNGLDLA